MKITNNGVPQPPINAAQTAPSATPPSRDSQAGGVGQDANTYTPSAEWTRLVDLVRQEPEIRSDRVRDVAERLQSGYYSSAESADKTADAILSSLDW